MPQQQNEPNQRKMVHKSLNMAGAQQIGMKNPTDASQPHHMTLQEQNHHQGRNGLNKPSSSGLDGRN